MFSKYNWCGMTSCGFTIDFYEIGILLIDDHKELAVIRLLSHHPIIRGRLHNDLPILWAPATSFLLNHEHTLTLKGCNQGQFTYIRTSITIDHQRSGLLLFFFFYKGTYNFVINL